MNIQKLTAVPSTPTTPNTFFFIARAEKPEHLELYVSSNDGNSLKRLINEADIEQKILQSLATAQKYKVVENIVERDKLDDTLQVYVKDASADDSVSSGGAFYIKDGSDWVKIAEQESLDINLSWDGISGKPNVSASDIETAVTQKHTHANRSELDKIGQDQHGKLTYDGKAVGGVEVVANW